MPRRRRPRRRRRPTDARVLSALARRTPAPRAKQSWLGSRECLVCCTLSATSATQRRSRPTRFPVLGATAPEGRIPQGRSATRRLSAACRVTQPIRSCCGARGADTGQAAAHEPLQRRQDDCAARRGRRDARRRCRAPVFCLHTSVAVPVPRFVRARPASRSRGPPLAPTRPPHPPRSPASRPTPSAGTGHTARKYRTSIPSMARGSDHVDPRGTSPAAPQSTIAPRCRATTALPQRVATAENRQSDPPGPALDDLKRRLASPAAREPHVLTISRPVCGVEHSGGATSENQAVSARAPTVGRQCLIPLTTGSAPEPRRRRGARATRPPQPRRSTAPARPCT
jgi:hypothetical protein